MTDKPHDRLLSTATVARILDISPAKVLELIHAGELAAKRRTQSGRGGVPRYACLQSAVNEYILSLPDVVNRKSGRVREAKPRRRKLEASGVIEFV